ncbi:hypothetical protein [Acuticoccus sp. MNP-M23]|uniref:hypothetical protein n=1 Tax=Acuticoccus sp. MNP-M23 TaxID=3072793 RepID=UPI0035C194B1
MMDRKIGQASLFYEFNLEDRVPAGHLIRRVDAVLDLSSSFAPPHQRRYGPLVVRPGARLHLTLCEELWVVKKDRCRHTARDADKLPALRERTVSQRGIISPLGW